MLTNVAATAIAQALVDQGLFKEVRFGDGGKTPEATDAGLNGGLVAQETIEPTVNGAVINIQMEALRVEAGTVRELGIFDKNGQLTDRYVIGPMTGKPGAQLQVEYALEVVTDA